MPMFAGVMTEKNFDIVEKLEAFVKARGRTMLELAFSWLATRPTVASVIAGATKPEQIEANVKAAEWQLTPEEMAEIDKLTKA
jgi:aryl-alcohol dehydrogenase-like predicted oxidoreductase